MSDKADREHPEGADAAGLPQIWRRIHEHKMVQWCVAYLALAYGIQHAVVLTSEAFDWAHAVQRATMLVLVLGVPVAITFAWYQGARASRNFSQAELSILTVLLVIGSLLFYVFVRPSADIAATPALQQAGVTAARQASLSPSTAISLAVMPFENLSPDTNQGYFADGTTEEITTALAKIPDLRVVARQSAFAFKGKNQDVRVVGKALGATHLIEGTIRKSGEKLRISAQLVQADTGVTLWANSYDRELKDVFAVQEDIARSIAASLHMTLGLKSGENLISNRKIDPESYEQYLRARALVRARGFRENTEAAALLEDIVAHNPDYAPGWALLSYNDAYAPLFHPAYVNGLVDEARRVVDASLPKAEAAAQRAIQLDPNLAAGYFARALGLSARGKFLLAENLYSKSLALDPGDPDALHSYSYMLAALGQLQKAASMRQQLQALDPLDAVYISGTGQVLWLNGQSDAAVAVLKADPNLRLPGSASPRVLAQIYAAEGHYSEAADVLVNFSGRANVLPKVTQEAVRLLRSAPAPSASPESLPRLGNLSFVYAYIGAPNRILEYHETNIAMGYSLGAVTSLLWQPSYASLRKTERFKNLVREAGLVAYWRAKRWPDFCHPTTGDDFACN